LSVVLGHAKVPLVAPALGFAVLVPGFALVILAAPTGCIGLLLALLGAAVWADLQPIYWTLESIKWLLARVTQVLPREPAAGADAMLRERYAQAWGAAESDAYLASLRSRFKARIEPGVRMQTDTEGSGR
jgi:hypothetical protein